MLEPGPYRSRSYVSRIFIRFSWLIAIAGALALVPVVHQYRHLTFHSSADLLLQGDQRSMQTFEKVRSVYRDATFIACIVRMDKVFSYEGARRIRDITHALYRMSPDVLWVESLTQTKRPVGLSLKGVPFAPVARLSTNEWARLHDIAMKHPFAANSLASGDGKHTLLLAVVRGELPDAGSRADLCAMVQRALAPLQQKDSPIQILSLPHIEVELRSAIRHDLARFVPIGLASVIVLLLIAFRSPLICLLIVLNEAVSLALLPALFSLYGSFKTREITLLSYEFGHDAGTVNLYSMMLFPLLAAIHLAFLVHLFSAFRLARFKMAGREALCAAVDETIKPSFLAALTTAIGLLSLAFCEVPAVRDFGILGAIAIAVAFVWTFGPGLSLATVLLGRSKLPKDSPSSQSSFELGSSSRLRRRWVASSAALILVLVAAPGIRRIRTDIRAVEFVRPESPTRKVFTTLDQNFGGANLLQLDIDAGRDGGLLSMAFLRYLENIRVYAESIDGMSAAYSYSQFFSIINHAVKGERPGTYCLPDSPLTILAYSKMMEKLDFPLMDEVRDRDLRRTSVFLRTKDMRAHEYLAVLKKVIAFAEREKPDGTSVMARAGLHTVLEADQKIVRSQFRSLGVSLAVIFVVLAMLWWGVRDSILALLSALLPLVVMMGVAGYAGVTLNSITMMVAAVVLGIGVDDAIHFLSHYREEAARLGPGLPALRETLRAKTRPIVCTTAILVSMLCLFAGSSFPPVRAFGLLAVLALLLQMLSVIFLIPAVLALRKPGAEGRT